MTNEVKLTVLSTGESVYLLRTVATSIAARRNFSLDDIDDLTLAVSEAAAFLLMEASNATRLTMRVAASDEGVQTVLSIDAVGVDWPPPNLENGLAWKVLSALTDVAEFIQDPLGPSIRLVKKGSSGEVAS